MHKPFYKALRPVDFVYGLFRGHDERIRVLPALGLSPVAVEPAPSLLERFCQLVGLRTPPPFHKSLDAFHNDMVFLGIDPDAAQTHYKALEIISQNAMRQALYEYTVPKRPHFKPKIVDFDGSYHLGAYFAADIPAADKDAIIRRFEHLVALEYFNFLSERVSKFPQLFRVNPLALTHLGNDNGP